MNQDIVRVYPSEYKRYCLALDLKDNPSLITEYLNYHSPAHFWKEIGEGIQKSGIEIMDIYNVDNRLFMICEMPVNVDFDTAWKEIGSYERQDEWEQLMSTFQQALPAHKLEWVKMKKVFSIPEE